jgi:hypothetical protein
LEVEFIKLVDFPGEELKIEKIKGEKCKKTLSISAQLAALNFPFLLKIYHRLYSGPVFKIKKMERKFVNVYYYYASNESTKNQKKNYAINNFL